VCIRSRDEVRGWLVDPHRGVPVSWGDQLLVGCGASVGCHVSSVQCRVSCVQCRVSSVGCRVCLDFCFGLVLWERSRDGEYFGASFGCKEGDGKIRLVWGRYMEGLYGVVGVFVYC